MELVTFAVPSCCANPPPALPAKFRATVQFTSVRFAPAPLKIAPPSCCELLRAKSESRTETVAAPAISIAPASPPLLPINLQRAISRNASDRLKIAPAPAGQLLVTNSQSESVSPVPPLKIAP